MEDLLRFTIPQPPEDNQDISSILDYLSVLQRNYNTLVMSLNDNIIDRSDIASTIGDILPTTRTLVVNGYLNDGNVWVKNIRENSSWMVELNNDSTNDFFTVKYSSPNEDVINWKTYATINNTGKPLFGTDIVTSEYISSSVDLATAQLWAMLASLQSVVNGLDTSKQNLWETIAGDAGTTSASSATDTLSIVGAGTVSTSITGDTLTITGTVTPDTDELVKVNSADTTAGYLEDKIVSGTGISLTVAVDDSDIAIANTDTGSSAVGSHESTYDHTQLHASGSDNQNLWATISADAGSTTADSTTDTLNIVGSGGVTTSISGDTLTITGSGGAPTGLEALPNILLLMGC